MAAAGLVLRCSVPQRAWMCPGVGAYPWAASTQVVMCCNAVQAVASSTYTTRSHPYVDTTAIRTGCKSLLNSINTHIVASAIQRSGCRHPCSAGSQPSHAVHTHMHLM